jgi:predicted transcriptional regulator
MLHRDRYDIVKNLLEILNASERLYRNQMNKTRIGYSAGLTYFQTAFYLKGLLDIGLLEMTDFKPYSYYEITEKGRRCLELFSAIEDDLRSIE